MIAHANPLNDAMEYCRAVADGSIVAGHWQRLACQRHLDDLKNAGDRGFYFDYDEALRSLEFFPRILRHSLGEYSGKSFILSPWQKFVTACLFGWKSRDEMRRFRKAYLSVARKNGKTTLVAGYAAKLLYFDGEPGAEVYCAATKEEQAKIMFRETLRMVEQSPALMKRSTIRKVPASISSGYSSFRPLGSDGKSTDGLNPHGILLDELHGWRERHRDFKERLESGSGSRRQPLEIVITTAGDDHSQLWIEEDSYATKVLQEAADGRIIDDQYFAFVCRVDEEDDPFDETNWIKANPNLGVSVKMDYLRSQANEARNRPTETNKFIRFHANQRTGSHEVLIPRAVWAMGGLPLEVKDGDSGHGGIDIGRASDWAAASICFPLNDRWHIVSRSWTCRNGDFQVDREPFRSWINSGDLACCDGNSIDPQAVMEWAVAMSQKYDVKTWAIDPNFAKLVGQLLKDTHGLNVFEFTQSPKFYNEPTRNFEIAAKDGRLIHGGDPVLAWQVQNMQVVRNAKDEWMPDKGNKESKIDGVVATLMAFSECLFAAKNQVDGSLIIT